MAARKEKNCPMMVAHAAPATPRSKVKMNSGSRIVLMMAPISVQVMEYLGLPSARISLLMPVVMIWKGMPRAMILE